MDVVFDDQHQRLAGVRRQGGRLRFVCLGRGLRLGIGQRQRQAEHGAATGPGAQAELMAKQPGRALHDGQSQPQALAAVAFGVAQLMEFPEDAFLLMQGYARPLSQTSTRSASPSRRQPINTPPRSV